MLEKLENFTLETEQTKEWLIWWTLNGHWFKWRNDKEKINKSWTSNFQIPILVNFLSKIQSHSDFNL